MLANKLMGGVEEKLYVDDVFSTYLYTGNGSTQTINNGIDLAGEGGLVWTKMRNGGSIHNLTDTVRGARISLSTDNTNAQYTSGTGQDVTGFLQTGYTLGTNNAATNASGANYVSWTFRKAPKFFDVVTYTGDGVAGRQIPHNLGVAPGMIIVKAISTTSSWFVWHRGASGTLKLQATDMQNADFSVFNNTSPTSSVFSVDGSAANASFQSYIAYLFAHDPSEDGIIQCGSFTTDASGNATVNLGWEPQFGELKRSDLTGNWLLRDSMRGWVTDITGSGSANLNANLADAETFGAAYSPTATGFKVAGIAASATFIYLAIRRPNKPPTSGTEVYQPIAYSGTATGESTTTISNILTANFDVDMVLNSSRNSGYHNHKVWDRLRGSNTTAFGSLDTTSTSATDGAYGASYTKLDLSRAIGLSDYTNYTGRTYIANLFRRAPGFFDVVCYTGTGVARTVNHNLGAVPELIITKSRTPGGDGATSPSAWWVCHKDLPLYGSGSDPVLSLNTTNSVAYGGGVVYWNNANTATTFQLGDSGGNMPGYSSIAYLFATLPGISKVGNYTGNGTSQTINCGFTTGARFVLCKRTDSTGDWYVWDTARGIVAANDPHLSLNTTAAEVTTDDSVDPESTGFIVNQNTATNINVNGASYIYLAIA